MSTFDIDYSVLDDVIVEIYSHHKGDHRATERICTSLVENSYVDDTWGHLIYQEDGNYTENGMDIDMQILEGLEQYVAALIKTL